MKFITLELLTHFKAKLDGLFVAKENKTGSSTEYKVLSDNNLTDDLVLKINASGDAADIAGDIGAAKSEAVADANAYTDTVKDDLEAAIAEKISTAYKVKGSTAFAALPAPEASEEGNVYNVGDEFATTGMFLEGPGKKYPAGTNVVCVEESDGVFKWDVIAGFIDADLFVKNADIEAVTTADIDGLFAA